jgi:hypothetical protein
MHAVTPAQAGGVTPCVNTAGAFQAGDAVMNDSSRAWYLAALSWKSMWLSRHGYAQYGAVFRCLYLQQNG